MEKKINGKLWIIQGQVCNDWGRTGKVVATVFGSFTEVKNGCKKYNEPDIQFYLERVRKNMGGGYFYSARVIKGYGNEYGKLYIEDKALAAEKYENTAADDFLDYLSEQW